jgi:hypothetical protein
MEKYYRKNKDNYIYINELSYFIDNIFNFEKVNKKQKYQILHFKT